MLPGKSLEYQVQLYFPFAAYIPRHVHLLAGISLRVYRKESNLTALQFNSGLVQAVAFHQFSARHLNRQKL